MCQYQNFETPSIMAAGLAKVCFSFFLGHHWLTQYLKLSAASSRSCICCVMGKNCFKDFWAACCSLWSHHWWVQWCTQWLLEVGLLLLFKFMKVEVSFLLWVLKIFSNIFKDKVVRKRIDFLHMMKVLAWSLKGQKAFWVNQEMSHTNNHFLLEMQGRFKNYDCSRDI